MHWLLHYRLRPSSAQEIASFRSYKCEVVCRVSTIPPMFLHTSVRQLTSLSKQSTVFWEQQGTTPFGGQRVQITRPPIASQPAFNKHFTALLSSYPHIQVLNLLSSRDHEALLSNAYREHVRNANAQLFDDNDSEKIPGVHSRTNEEIGYTEFDFHAKVKLAGGIESVRNNIRRDPDTGGSIDQFGFCLAGVSHTPHHQNQEHEEVFESLIAKQNGVFRVNCLDCLE